jgi:hypothetical protein
MYPLLFDAVPLYFVMWACAIVTAVAVGARLGARAGFSAGRSAVAMTLLALSVLVGSKLLYVAEAYWFPGDDYVPQSVRTSSHGFPVTVGTNVLVNNSNDGNQAQNSPEVAIDRVSNPNKIAAGATDYSVGTSGVATAGYYFSTDGGSSWPARGAVPGLTNYGLSGNALWRSMEVAVSSTLAVH